jgi:hypothetical protein
MLTPIPDRQGSSVQSAAIKQWVADVNSARLWLSEGFPIADVLTMLEVRHRFDISPESARTYAIEILLAIEAETRLPIHQPISPQKEPRNAVA